MNVERFFELHAAHGARKRPGNDAVEDQLQSHAEGIPPDVEVRRALGGVAYAHRHLDDRDPSSEGSDNDLGLKREALAPNTQPIRGGQRVAPKAALRICDGVAGEQAHPVVGDPVAPLVGQRCAIAGHVADPQHQRAAIGHHAVEADRVLDQVLTVGVEREESVESPALCHRERGAQGRSLPLVRSVGDHMRACRTGSGSRPIGGPIVDDPHFVEAPGQQERSDQLRNTALRVKRGQRRDASAQGWSSPSRRGVAERLTLLGGEIRSENKAEDHTLF